MNSLNRPSSFKTAGWLLAISAALTFLLKYSVVPLTDQNPLWLEPGDFHTYYQMARLPLWDFHMAPFCWRILTPLIAKVLPFTLETNFSLLTGLSLTFTGWICALWVGNELKSNTASLYSLLLFFSLGWLTKYNLYNFWLSDPLVFLFLILSLWVHQKNRSVWLMLVLPLGALAKESIFFIVPTLYLKSWMESQDSAKRFSILWISLALTLSMMTCLWVRTFIPAYNTDQNYVDSVKHLLYDPNLQAKTYDYTNRLSEFWQRRSSTFSLKAIHSMTTHAFGFFIFLAALWHSAAFPKRFGIFLPLLGFVYFQLLLASNTERLLVLAFPYFILSGTQALLSLQETFKTSWVYCALLPLLQIILFFYHPMEWNACWQIQIAVLVIWGTGFFFIRFFKGTQHASS